MSSPGRRGATYYEGQFQVLTETDDKTMTLQLISDPWNGILCANLDAERGFVTEQQDMCYMVESYSLDKKEWIPVDKWEYSVWVKPGQSLWIRLEKKKDAEQYRWYKELKWVNSFTLNCDYSGCDDALLSIYVDEGRAVSTV